MKATLSIYATARLQFIARSQEGTRQKIVGNFIKPVDKMIVCWYNNREDLRNILQNCLICEWR